MGVPAFFRWLSRKYPSIVVNTNEEKPQQVEGVTIPVDSTQSNPNGVEFDNFYLDMNGIIHPCCHPEDRPAPRNEDEMMANIFEYIDRLFRIVRPRRLLYMAIDGVAPRAKMNQQRSRRFRAAKDSDELKQQIASVRAELASQGIPLPPDRRPDEHFDSNCITPGTPFMARLAVCLRYYIHERLNNDSSWKNLLVILSDASSPGEGEHKIMDFVRKQRASPGHDPNTQHILCGADADLIMLGLATHEPNFTIIREEFVPGTQRPCELCHQYGHDLKACQGLSTIKSGEYGEVAQMCQRDKNFIFIRLSVLREYLARELAMPNLPFEWDLERAIDDWVFMCFFVGNDFLPHLPSLEIREGAIDRLIKLYKECVHQTYGYLTDNGWVELARVQLILNELGAVEDDIFRTRQQNELQQRQREKDRKKRMKAATAPAYIPNNSFAPVAIDRFGGAAMSGSEARQAAYEMRMANKANEDAARALKASIGGRPTVDDTAAALQRAGVKRKHDEVEPEEEEEEPEPNDEVRLWEEGWKERYYQSKFEVSSEDTKFRCTVAQAYAEGLCWVLRYYYQGVPDWSWFYPYHYAPFASDFVDIGNAKLNFDEDSKPVAPLVQLMSVFPAGSRKHLPEAWSNLMVNKDSPIIDFYPCDFQVDLNGKRFAWQGVALLPFVDSARLAETLVEVEQFLTEEERSRNQRGDNEIFLSKHHKAHESFIAVYENEPAPKKRMMDDDEPWIQVDPDLTYGTSGMISVDPEHVPLGGSLKSVMTGFPDINDNQATVVLYRDPVFPPKHRFSSARLPGAVDPPATLKPREWNDRQERYRPMIGFSRDLPRMELDISGKRMIRAPVGGYGHSQSQEYQMHGHYRNPTDPQAYGNYQSNGNWRSNQRYQSNERHDSYSNRGGRGGGSVHWQQAMRHQSNAYNNQQQQYGPRGGHAPPYRGSSSYGSGQSRGSIQSDPHQRWQQPPSRYPNPQQQPQRWTNPQQQGQQTSAGRNKPSAADYF